MFKCWSLDLKNCFSDFSNPESREVGGEGEDTIFRNISRVEIFLKCLRSMHDGNSYKATALLLWNDESDKKID